MNTNTAPVLTSATYLLDPANPHFGSHTTGVVEITRRDGFVQAYLTTETDEELAAVVAAFPKSTRIRSTTLSGVYGAGRRLPMLSFSASLRADGVNGGVNETGIKRLATFDRIVAQLGLTVTEK